MLAGKCIIVKGGPAPSGGDQAAGGEVLREDDKEWRKGLLDDELCRQANLRAERGPHAAPTQDT